MNEILLNTAQRWCLPEPIGFLDDPWTSCTSLEASIDLFLDRNLYELPIPRYATKYDSWAYKDLERNVHSMNLALQNVMSRLVQTGKPFQHLESLSETSKMFHTLFPSLEYLRSMDLTLETQAIVIVVLGTCPNYLHGMPKKYVYKGETAFCKTTLEHLHSIFKEKPKDTLDLLKIADDFIRSKELKAAMEKMPKAKCYWLPWTSSKDLYNVPSESIARVEESIKAFSKALHISESYLLHRCMVENLIDEHLKFGFLQ